ncbi:MAG: bifunctional 3-deoxy-7-phosphoheptulonate synthase/chorismate mutase type II [Bacteroidales bacterium]|nr:bifunctional 3-deoxy-7-phosphoheptulonate synthase/chorismate mutase type II [Bacteroidales bacterium]
MRPIIIAGPCAAESSEQLFTTAQQVCDVFSKSSIPITYFRAGVWKPRSQPNDFIGAGDEALAWMKQIESRFGLVPCVEIARPEHVEACLNKGIHTFWIGSRTTVNPFLIQELADSLKNTNATVMIKNPVTPDLKLWIGGVERFMKNGLSQLMAIHRGFYESSENVFRNAPNWQIPIEFKLHFPEIPLICDPSHLTGNPHFIASVSQIALDYGFDGLMIETHHNPAKALSDGAQQITPETLGHILQALTFKSKLSTPAEIDLRKQRTLLHNIDTQISTLLAKRMQLVDEIATIKKENNLPIVQPSQWNKVVETYTDNALDDKHFQTFLTKFLELLHQQSIERQQNNTDNIE